MNNINKRYLMISLFFFLTSVLCLVRFLYDGDFQTYTATGTIIFALVGLGFLRRSKLG